MDNSKEQNLRTWARTLYQALETNDGSRSLVDCMDSASDGQSGIFRDALNAVRQVVCFGYPLSRAMAQHPNYFPADLVTIVRYGEIYGELDVVLRRYVERPEDTAPRCRLPVTP